MVCAACRRTWNVCRNREVIRATETQSTKAVGKCREHTSRMFCEHCTRCIQLADKVINPTKLTLSFEAYLHSGTEFVAFPGIQVRGGADKSLARPGRKQTTATKLGIYSTYSPRSSIHFLARCSDFCKPPPKNSERCPSKQISAAVMTSASEEKWRPFNCFFSPGNSW